MGVFDAHKNFPISTVATAPSPATSGTSLVVASGHGTRFPTAPFNATVWPIDVQPTPANAEIVRVTARSTDTLTIARAQEGTSARTVVVGDQIAATITAETLTDVERSILPPITEWINFGHSGSTGLGGTSAEWSWPHRAAKALGAEFESFAQNGAVLLNADDASFALDGGIFTVGKKLLRLLAADNRTAHPYLTPWGLISFQFGVNDIAYFDPALDKTRDSFKTSLRAAIGLARTGRWYQGNNAAITKAGSTHSGATGSEDKLLGPRFEWLTTANAANYWQFAVPSNYPGGGAIWIFLISTSGGAGFTGDVLVDGGTPEAINNVVGATSITNLSGGVGLGGAAAFNSAQGYRIPITAAGSHTVRLTPTTIASGFAPLAGFSIEAPVPPPVIVLQHDKEPSYASWSVPFTPSDTRIDTLNGWISDVVAELDERVIMFDPYSVLNKNSRYYAADSIHYNDEGAEAVAGGVLDAIRSKGLLSGRDIMQGSEKGSVVASKVMVKRPCRIATVTNISVTSAPATIDGVTPDIFDRILVKNQTAPAENGIWLWIGASRPMERATDFDSPEEIKGGVTVSVLEGSNQNNRTTWMLANQTAVVVGTTAIQWTRTFPDITLQPQRSFWTPGSNSIETIPGIQAATNLAALSSGRLSLVGGIVLPAGQPITNISFMSATTAAGTPTNQLFGLYRQSDRALLRSTTNGTTGAWAANTVKTLALTSTYTPNEDTPIYLGIMVTATTVPTLLGASATVAANTIAPAKHGTSNTGLTTSLPDPANALSVVANNPYGYVS